jgi:hypothetical protein
VRRWTIRANRGGPRLGRLLEGVSHERARCGGGIPPLKSPPIAEHIQAVGVSTRNLTGSGHLLMRTGPKRVRPVPSSSVKQFETQAPLSFPALIREIEIWRVAVPMVNRYADEAEANRLGRAEELRPKCDSRRSAPKLAAARSRWGGCLASGHSRDRAVYRHDGTTELIMVQSRRRRTHMSVTEHRQGTAPGLVLIGRASSRQAAFDAE